jgi:signal transduction histidine kinase/DNA-binding LacI/PurR family transcriptional regulator
MPAPTIGLLITDLTRTWTIQQWSGVRDAARRRGANLVTFDGRHLRSPYGFNAQANILYELARSGRMDGLIVWTEGLVSYLAPAEGVAFLSRYAGMPLVSVEHNVDGYPNVLSDDFGAMRSVLCHLIEVHGHRRIAFVRHATPSHRGFTERYRAYRETLEEHGIPFDPALVSPPIEAEAPPAAFILADWMQRERASTWDAVVAHNDLSAFHALRDLRSLGAKLERMPAVTGFDDSEEGLVMNPPLTTVRPPFREMAGAAVEMLLDLIQGKPADSPKVLRGELIIRRSCGCPDPVAVTARPLSGPAVDEPAHEELAREVLAEAGGMAEGGFLRRLDALIEEAERTDEGLPELGDRLSMLRARTLAGLEEGPRRRAEDLIDQGRVLVGRANGRRQKRLALEALQREAALRNAEASLFSKFSVAGIMDGLADALPGLGIPSCCVSLYEDAAPYAYPDAAPEQSRLVLSFGPGGRLDTGTPGLRFPSRQLAPPQAWPSAEPFDLVAEALYFRDYQLGFVLFGVGPGQGEVYESLRAVVANDLQGARLVEQERRHLMQLRDGEEERRQLESMLHQAQKLEAVGQLAGGVAHEFNNILTGIMGFSSIVLMDMKGDDPRRGLVERILAASRKAADLAQRMLILSQKNTARPSLIDLNAAVESGRASLAALLGEKIALTVEPWKEGLPVLADNARIQQVLTNLAENARDAMTGGGTVVIRLTAEEITAEGRPPGFPPGLYARVVFSDTGSGMDELTQARLFEPFFTTKDIGKGTGLGLAIVWAIIEQHHGAISVTSTPGAGTAFDILLPIQKTPDYAEEPFQPVESLHGTETILVADVDPAARQVICSTLEQHGYTVTGASDGQEALSCFRQRGGRIHLVILDTMMAGIDGWEVAREIRRHSPAVKIIFTSQYAPSRFGSEPLRVDDRRLLLKPFSPFQLVEKVRTVLDE